MRSLRHLQPAFNVFASAFLDNDLVFTYTHISEDVNACNWNYKRAFTFNKRELMNLGTFLFPFPGMRAFKCFPMRILHMTNSQPKDVSG